MRKYRQFAFVCLVLGMVSANLRAQSLPLVVLDANEIGPRPIEELTKTNIARNYAQAWQSLQEALQQNRPQLLDDRFTGFARDRLLRRIETQKQTGLRTQIVDRGHRLKAVFYSPTGDAMQLLDEASIEIQVFDGRKLIYSERQPQRYTVLMTPGADCWYVRTLETTGATQTP